MLAIFITPLYEMRNPAGKLVLSKSPLAGIAFGKRLNGPGRAALSPRSDILSFSVGGDFASDPFPDAHVLGLPDEQGTNYERHHTHSYGPAKAHLASMTLNP